ncbi:hypothetical protein EMCRGX_G034128 [Ephydatia muelleri]
MAGVSGDATVVSRAAGFPLNATISAASKAAPADAYAADNIFLLSSETTDCQKKLIICASNRAGQQGWTTGLDNRAGQQGWITGLGNRAGQQGWTTGGTGLDNRAGQQGWTTGLDNRAGQQGWTTGLDNRAGQQGWTTGLDNRAGRQGWTTGLDDRAGQQGWTTGLDNRAGRQGWTTGLDRARKALALERTREQLSLPAIQVGQNCDLAQSGLCCQPSRQSREGFGCFVS